MESSGAIQGIARPSAEEDHLARVVFGARVVWFPFGYEYEVLYPGARKLFGFDDRLVFEAERDGRFYVIEDLGSVADFSDPEFGEVLEEQVRLIEFATAEARDKYLEKSFVAARPWLRGWISEAREER